MTETIVTDWKPIAEGSLLESARATGADLEAALRELIAAGKVVEEKFPGGAAGFAGGHAGQALLFAELHTAGREGAGEIALAQVDKAAELISSEIMPPSLFSGFVGVAATLSLMEGRLLEVPEESATQEIDELLLTHLKGDTWRRDYDIVSGLTGFGVYALSRLPNPVARDLVAEIVRRMDEMSEPMAVGISWHTPATMMLQETAERYPSGYYNLGLAHGIPGPLGFLGQAIAEGIEVERARRLFEGAAAWMLSSRLADPKPGATLPAFTGAEAEYAASRSAWCYGDPGAAIGLWVGADAAGYDDLAAQALEMAVAASQRPMDECGVIDAGICHGAAGLAHMYNRLYQATGRAELREAAGRWLEQMLKMRKPGTGIAGYQAWGPSRDFEDDPGLLTGVCGLLLVILAATEPHQPRWDHLLLMAPSPRAAQRA
ncbi:MAG TPA: lanthionine synthetase C family protein [Candidatus Dormibacteraeota bacterium]|jgi:lantibiotic modifying enzyme|nr:lanthionine synthetase C family protein [Candidatus Dormibacteraeota bacterium]